MLTKDAKGKALLIIDVQNDFVGNNARMPVDQRQGEKMLANINKIVDTAEAKHLAVIYIGNEYGRFDPFNIFRNFAAIKNTDGTKLSDRLHVVGENYFPKNKANAFSNPELNLFLQAERIEELYFCGLYAEACIYATLKGAVRNHYAAYVLTDCIASKSDKKLSKMIAQYRKIGVRTITSGSLL